tara:strand:+ start:309 stop:518 length:210 start_codon:yes stop_codon:yes gene_type:complete
MIITKDDIKKEYLEGNYFSDGTAIKYDYQNGTIETVAFCDEKEFAEHCAEALNILFNLNNDGIETKENE